MPAPRQEEPRAGAGNRPRQEGFSIASDPTARRLAFASVLCAVATGALALATLAGWLADMPLLASLHPSFIPMAPNTAFSFLVLALAVASLRREPRPWVLVSAALVGAVALLRLVEFLTGVALGVDGWLLRVPAGYLGRDPIGKMAFFTALNFVFAAAAVGLLRVAAPGRSLARTLGAASAVVVTFVGMVFLLGYFYSAPLLYDGELIPMAVNTAAAFVLLGLSLGLEAARRETAERHEMQALLQSAYEETRARNEELLEARERLLVVNAELQEVNARLAQSNQQKNHLLGMAAHDIRNPLWVILGYSSFLADGSEGDLNDTQQLFLENIRSSAHFLVQLVDSLLDLSAIESGKVTLDLQEHDLLDLVGRCVRLNAAVAKSKGIELEFRAPEPFALVRCDGPKLIQVMNNLLSNAIKYSLPGKRVVIDLACEGEEIAIRVADEGQGIPADEQEKLFRPFGRTSVRSTGGEKSTGLGLAIAMNIVQGHGGTIRLESLVDRGSTFEVRLPLRQVLPESVTLALPV